MCNSIFLSEKTIPKAKDGDVFELTIKGVYHTEDGVRKLDVSQVDGSPVGDPEECGCGEDHEELMNRDSDEALTMFFIKPKKEIQKEG